MSDVDPAKWAVGLADEFTYQLNVITTKRELERQTARAELAEKRVARWERTVEDLRHLRLGRVARKLRNRKTSGGAKQASAGKQGDDLDALSPLPSSPSQTVDAREAALNARLRVVLTEFGKQTSANQPLSQSISDLADLLTERPKDKPLAWLSYIAIRAKYPVTEDVMRFATEVQVSGAPRAIAFQLRITADAKSSWFLTAELELVRDVVVDATLASRRSFHTGIQRVVRETVPRWAAKHPVKLISWTADGNYRPPTPAESWRVMEFEPRVTDVPGANDKNIPTTIRVPWRTTVIAVEPTSPTQRSEALACLSEWSGNELATIFYDFVVFLFPEMLKVQSRLNLTDFNISLRSSHRVSTISAAVGSDVAKYTEIVGNSGLPMPQVRGQVLPVEAEVLDDEIIAANTPRLIGVPGLPLVVSVGSIEPRKNHLMTLRAAERLWQEGVGFQLVLIGWGSWRADAVMEEFERLQARGRPVRMIRRADEDLLWTAYQIADFSVYISLAEGYGLPAAESIATGTPVVLSNIGAMAEIGAGGGAVMVDPRDLDSVADAMRGLLTDSNALAAVTAEAKQRPQKTWDEYADETWSWLVNGE